MSTRASAIAQGDQTPTPLPRQARFFLHSPTLSTGRPSHTRSRSDLSIPSSSYSRRPCTESDSRTPSAGSNRTGGMMLRRFSRRKSLSMLPVEPVDGQPQGEVVHGINNKPWSSADSSAEGSRDVSHEDIRLSLDYRLQSLRDARDRETRMREDQMEALVQIHEVLYRGYPLFGESVKEQSEKVETVIDRWFEGDCVYDHPLLRVSSRQYLMTHFTLLHLLSTLFVPSPTPSSIIHHIHTFTSTLRRTLSGDDSVDVEAGLAFNSRSGKGKARALSAGDESDLKDWTGSTSRVDDGDSSERRGWMKVWEIRGECLDLGAMESYDGYHLALIDQVITLTILPTLLPTHQVAANLHPVSSTSSLSSINESSSGFLHSMASSVAREFDFLLKWDLRIRTYVEFNEVGRITRITDSIDIQDLIEATVPFARRFGWLTKRLTGYITSSLGYIATSIISSPRDRKVGFLTEASTPVLQYPISKTIAKVPIGEGDSSTPLPTHHATGLLGSPFALQPIARGAEDMRSHAGLSDVVLVGAGEGMAPDTDGSIDV